MIQKSYKRHSQYKFICVFASHQLKEVIVCEALLEIGDEVPNTNLLENDVERLKKKWLATLGCGDDDEVDDEEYGSGGESDDDDEESNCEEDDYFEYDNEYIELLEDSRKDKTFNNYIKESAGLFSVSEMEDLKKGESSDG